MVLDQLRPGSQRVLLPFARLLARLRITPNMLSVFSLLCALGAGVALYVSSPSAPWWLFAASLLIGLNAFADAVDGVLARLTNTESRLGDLVDHVIDRYADTAMVAGLALSVWVDVRVGLFALIGTALTSYMGTQAQALGLGRNYGGLLGRADRIALLIAGPALEWIRLLAGWPTIYGFSLLAIIAWWLAIAGNVTAVQRVIAAMRDLKREPPVEDAASANAAPTTPAESGESVTERAGAQRRPREDSTPR